MIQTRMIQEMQLKDKKLRSGVESMNKEKDDKITGIESTNVDN